MGKRKNFRKKLEELSLEQCGFFEDELEKFKTKYIGYAPYLGYRAHLFSLDKRAVVLYDTGNCHYTVGMVMNPLIRLVHKPVSIVYNSMSEVLYRFRKE